MPTNNDKFKKNLEQLKKKSIELEQLKKESIALDLKQNILIINSINEKPKLLEDPKDPLLSKAEAELFTLPDDSDQDKNDQDENDIFPIILTTWSNRETGQLLAYRIGFGGKVGGTINDVSHLNISRDEFMSKAMPLIMNGSSASSIKGELEESFPAQKTYSKFSEFNSNQVSDNDGLEGMGNTSIEYDLPPFYRTPN